MALTDSNGNATMTMPVQPMYGYGGGNGGGFGMNGFGNDGWWIILLLICLGGWGNNGWGNNGSGTNDLAYIAAMNGAMPGYSQSNDFSNLERENDIIRQDICQNFASVNQTLANGFQGIQTSFANAELSRSNTQSALMSQMYSQSLDAMQNNCGVRSAIDTGFANVNYNIASQECDTRNVIQNAIRDAVDTQREGTNAILSALNAQRIEAKDERIADLNAQLANANNAALMNGFMASQAQQTEGIKDYVANQFATNNPRPVPAFSVPAPYQYGNCGCGCGNM